MTCSSSPALTAAPPVAAATPASVPGSRLPVDPLPVDRRTVHRLDPLPVDPLPFPPPGWGPEQAGAAVAEAALALPRLAGPAQLVRALSTVVFRVGALAVKVHPPGTDPGHLARVHAALAVSAVALAATAPPVVTSHGVVTVTPWVPAAAPLGWRDVGRALRALHDSPAAAQLPPWTPLRRLPAQLQHLPAPYAQVLHDRRSLLLERLDRLSPVLPPGALHGDVSPGNVLRTPTGARWIDLDFASAGLREYDLAAVVRRSAAGEVTDRDYRRFVAGYGDDVRGWPGLALLDALCELSGLGFRLWTDRVAQRGSPWLAGELARLSEAPGAR